MPFFQFIDPFGDPFLLCPGVRIEHHTESNQLYLFAPHVHLPDIVIPIPQEEPWQTTAAAAGGEQVIKRAGWVLDVLIPALAAIEDLDYTWSWNEDRTVKTWVLE